LIECHGRKYPDRYVSVFIATPCLASWLAHCVANCRPNRRRSGTKPSSPEQRGNKIFNHAERALWDYSKTERQTFYERLERAGLVLALTVPQTAVAGDPVAWMVTRDSEVDGPVLSLTEEAANQNACLGLARTHVTPLYRRAVSPPPRPDANAGVMRDLIARLRKAAEDFEGCRL
jgi:hypothetical protein